MRADWEVKHLGELCEVLDSKRKPITKSDRTAGEYPYYGATGILDFVENYIFDERLVLIGEDGAKWGAGENTAFSADGKYWVNNHAHVIRPDRSKALDKWIIYFLNASDLSQYVTGLTVPKLNQAQMRSIVLPLPPLAEQNCIVSILDEAFEAIATAKANAEKNLQNARELFDSYLQSVFANPGADWEEKRLSNCLHIKHGFAFKSEYFLNKGKYVLLTPGNFFEAGGYRDRGEKQKYYVGEIPKDFILARGDLLVAMTEQAAGLLGSPIIVPEDDKFLHNQRLGLIIHKSADQFDNWFLFHLFNTKRIRKLIHDSASGVKVRHTSPNKILEIDVWAPPITEQRAIVAKLDALSEQTKKLEAIYRQKLADLDELKKSILHKAFSGELTRSHYE